MQALTKWLDDRALSEWPCLHGLAVDHAPLFDWIYDCGSLCLVLQTGWRGLCCEAVLLVENSLKLEQIFVVKFSFYIT